MLAHNVEKCRFLGLVRFMAELFRVPMLTERIMCESINVLLSNVEYALVNGIEAACVLLDTAGSLLDNPRTHAHMEAYFSRMQEFESDVHIPNRIRFLIQVTKHTFVSPLLLTSVQGSLQSSNSKLGSSAL
jgi:hypothetical protein